jgi:hypothetical protein
VAQLAAARPRSTGAEIQVTAALCAIRCGLARYLTSGDG